jgi:hypothetical protein
MSAKYSSWRRLISRRRATVTPQRLHAEFVAAVVEAGAIARAEGHVLAAVSDADIRVGEIRRRLQAVAGHLGRHWLA